MRDGGVLEVARELEGLGLLLDHTKVRAPRRDVAASVRRRRLPWFTRRRVVVVVLTPHAVGR